MSSSYQLGSKLGLDFEAYIERQADIDLYNKLLEGYFCYVLASRQMGKSSLQVRIKDRLSRDKFCCVTIDLSLLGSHDTTASQWYYGIGKRLIDQLNLQKAIDLKVFWEEYSDLSPLNRLGVLLEEIIVDRITNPLVIFVDEIDTTIRLDFTDDFFAWIRYCQQSKNDSPNSYYKLLNFCLLGVAKPEDLMKDKERTPFNIGVSIELLPFQEKQLDPLIKPLTVGLKGKAVNLDEVRHQIHYWTGGQPFLTQRLCQLIQSELNTIEPEREATSIAELVENNIINNWEVDTNVDKNSHLNTIQERLFKDEDKRISLLGLYLGGWRIY
jgi:hypothetical protein